MAVAHGDSIRDANLMRPAPVIAASQPDWSRQARFQALYVILRFVEKDLHGQAEIAAVLRNRQFMA
jgi:hypothetical protein